jgi:hypothetical protein
MSKSTKAEDTFGARFAVGHLNINGQPFNAASVKAMVDGPTSNLAEGG